MLRRRRPCCWYSFLRRAAILRAPSRPGAGHNRACAVAHVRNVVNSVLGLTPVVHVLCSLRCVLIDRVCSLRRHCSRWRRRCRTRRCARQRRTRWRCDFRAQGRVVGSWTRRGSRGTPSGQLSGCWGRWRCRAALVCRQLGNNRRLPRQRVVATVRLRFGTRGWCGYVRNAGRCRSAGRRFARNDLRRHRSQSVVRTPSQNCARLYLNEKFHRCGCSKSE